MNLVPVGAKLVQQLTDFLVSLESRCKRGRIGIRASIEQVPSQFHILLPRDRPPQCGRMKNVVALNNLLSGIDVSAVRQ